MSRDKVHPDTELLDQLRAGLLDDDPVRKAELETHLQGCQRCRQRFDWDGTLQPGHLAIPHPTQRLEHARQQAVRAPAARRPPRLVPFAVAAAVALVAVLLIRPALEPDAEQPRLAERNATEVPELYEELDFYLWLADHKGEKDSRT